MAASLEYTLRVVGGTVPTLDSTTWRGQRRVSGWRPARFHDARSLPRRAASIVTLETATGTLEWSFAERLDPIAILALDPSWKPPS